jgi:hypothetical protein
MDVCVRLFCVCVILCVGSGLAIGWSSFQRIMQTMFGIKKLKKRLRSKGLQSQRERERENLLIRVTDTCDRYWVSDCSAHFNDVHIHTHMHIRVYWWTYWLPLLFLVNYMYICCTWDTCSVPSLLDYSGFCKDLRPKEILTCVISWSWIFVGFCINIYYIIQFKYANWICFKWNSAGERFRLRR